MQVLLQYLDSVYPLTEQLKDHLAQVLKVKKLSAGDILQRKGQVCKNICFIEKGLLRCYKYFKNKEVNNWFMREGDVIASVKSFFTQQPSDEFIEALEDCVLYYVTFDELEYMYHHFWEFNHIGRPIERKYSMIREDLNDALRLTKAEERYQRLADTNPELIRRVPCKDIASYLGIAKGTLSRIRGQLTSRRGNGKH